MSVQRITSFKTFTELKGQQTAAKLHEEGKAKRAEIIGKIGAALEEMGVTSLKELDEEKRNALIARMFEDEAEDIEKEIVDLGKPEKHSEKEGEKVEAELGEGNAFIYAAAKAKAEGKTEFEHDGKKFKVTLKKHGLKESVLITEGTRGFFGKIDKSGNIQAVYTHYDSYPEWILPVIKKNYKNAKAVDAVIARGDNSGLDAIDKMNFYNDKNSMTPLQGKADSFNKFLKDASNSSAEFIYLYDERDKKWYMSDVYGDKKLKPAFEGLELEGEDLNEGLVSIKGGRIIANKVLNKLVDMEVIPVKKKTEDLLETIAQVITDAKMESVEVEGDDLNEARSINKIQNDWSKVTADMAAKAQEWKAAEGDAKAKILDELKGLTAKKKALEAELDSAVAGKDKDLELAVSEGNEFSGALKKAKEEGKDEFEVDGKTYKVESFEVNEAKYDKKKLLQIIKGKDDILVTTKNGDEFILYAPDNGNDENTAYWDSNLYVVGVIPNDGDEVNIPYGEIVKVEESVLTEGSHGMAKKLLQSLIAGETSSMEGIKMSKEMAEHFLNWVNTSPFGKRNDKLPLAMLVKASFNWGIERGLDPKLKGELADLKSSIKESVEINEAEVKSDEEFKEYAFAVLKKAFGEDFDEAKAQEVVDGILAKANGDYGDAVGMLSGSLGESVDEKKSDGTISDDEEEREDDLMANVEASIDDLIALIKKEANDIGGSFRAPGIESRVAKLIKAKLQKAKL